MSDYVPKYCRPGNNPVGWYVQHVITGAIVTPRYLRCDTEDECKAVCARYNALK